MIAVYCLKNLFKGEFLIKNHSVFLNNCHQKSEIGKPAKNISRLLGLHFQLIKRFIHRHDRLIEHFISERFRKKPAFERGWWKINASLKQLMIKVSKKFLICGIGCFEIGDLFI